MRPAGKQIVTGDFPVNIAAHPGGRFAAVLHSGYGRHQIVVVDVVSASVVGEFPVEETFYGVEFSRDGRELYCSGAGDEVIHAFTFRDGYLSDPKVLRIRDAKERGIPAGLALRVTEAPGSNAAVQVVPQLIPEGVDVTLPLPLPAFVTVSVGR